MKKIKKYICLVGLLAVLFSCEDFALGEKFLQKPPSGDVTIDTIFSNAEYARRVLWNCYDKLPFGLSSKGHYTAMKVGNIEGLTDLNNTSVNDSGERQIYYPGKYTAAAENKGITMTRVTKYRFHDYGTWEGIRHAWLFCENVDRVPDMSDGEKSRMKAEAKVLVAVFYANMFRHYGGLPLISHSLKADDLEFPKRSTLQQTVEFIVGLLDEAINCNELPWALPESERANWDGRITKASAMGLKVRVLLFAASPLFNSNEPHYPGQAADERLSWFGDYQASRWENAAKAAEDFFKRMKAEGFYRLVQKEDTRKNTFRQAFQDGYYTRGTTETLISSRRHYYTTNQESLIVQSVRWGGYCPTKEYFDMFQMADGTEFNWENPEHSKNPFINRDPRMYETLLVDGVDFKGTKIELFQENPADPANYPKGKNFANYPIDAASVTTGIAAYKFGLDRDGGELNNRVFQWPHLRLAEIYLSYAEALNELGRTKVKDALGMDAYDYVNALRGRVGMGKLPEMGQKEFREAMLRERACEFGWEEVRFFDLIRWKREDIFTKRLHGLKVYKHKTTKEYKFDVPLLEERAWQKTGGFSPKNYLSAFPADEIGKGYGLIQNPGWE